MQAGRGKVKVVLLQKLENKVSAHDTESRSDEGHEEKTVYRGQRLYKHEWTQIILSR